MFNVRLQRLGLGIIFFMSIFIVYLVYHDFYSTEPVSRKALGSQKHKMAYDMYGNQYGQDVLLVKSPVHRGFRPGSTKRGNRLQGEENYDGKETMPSLFDEEDDSKTNYDDDSDKTTVSFFGGLPVINPFYKDRELPQGFVDVGGAEVVKDKGLKMYKKSKVDTDYPKVGYKQFIGLAKFDNVANISEARKQQRQQENSRHGIRVNGLAAPPSSKPLNTIPIRNGVDKNALPSRKISYQEIRKNTIEHTGGNIQKNAPPGKKPRKKVIPVFPPPIDDSKLKRYIVYVCANSSWCGGWGDRQRGIVSLYLLSRVVGRHFKILMETPCDLSQFYIPHLVPWQLRPEEIRGKSSVQINTFLMVEFKDKVIKGDFNDVFPADVLFIKSNQDYYMRLRKNPLYGKMLDQWTGLRTKRGRFKWAWNELMQPTEQLLIRLQDIVGAGPMINKGLITKPLGTGTARMDVNSKTLPKLICAHVRMGRNPTIPMDEDFGEFNFKDIPVLQHFLAARDERGDARFFVATDFEGIRTEFRKFFGARIVENTGKIIHIDRQRADNSACVGFKVALLDQLVLSVCDFLVVSRSGFSIHASHMSNSTNQVYVMEEGNIAPLVVSK